jgi:carboxyl-terminal processing protease
MDTEEKQRFGLLRTVVTIFLTVAVLAIAYFAGVATGVGAVSLGGSEPVGDILGLPNPERAAEENVEESQVFWEAWDLIERDFYGDLPSSEERMQGAIEGVVQSLGDPYTAYIPPDAARMMREDTSGIYQGIGAYVSEAPEGGIVIIRVFEGSPAEEAGVRAGDIIVAADGEDVTQMSLNEGILLVRGPAGTAVTLTIYREGEQEMLEITVTRASLEVPTVEAEMLEDNIGYVALFEFNAQAGPRLRSAVQDLMDEGATSLIFDLRGNPGGLLTQAVDVADLFLPEGVILIERDVRGNEQYHESRDGDFAEEIPMVVLVDGSSVSASEVVAGAFQDHGRAVLIGETTFGKGAVQLQHELSDGSLLLVAYAHWFTPNDVSINGQGITPDIEVASLDEPTDEDPQLERAIHYLQTGQ